MNAIRFLVALSCSLYLTMAATRAADGVALGGKVTVQFADLATGNRILGTRDDFIAALTPFERAARMVTNREVSEQEFLEFARTNVLAWTPEETNRLTRALQTVAQRLAPWHLPFPETVWLIKSTGHEEIDADYTRQNAIIQPVSMLRSLSPDILQHELFHVLSRANPELREKLYGLIGFQRINEVAVPAELAGRLWTNPDGVQNGWRLQVTNQNETLSVVPDLFAPANFTYTNVVNPFSFFRLLEVENVGGKWRPKLTTGHPRLLSLREVTGFTEQTGRNTRYVIHPDEILADNFVLLLNNRTNLATPRIIAEMKEIFTPYHRLPPPGQ